MDIIQFFITKNVTVDANIGGTGYIDSIDFDDLKSVGGFASGTDVHGRFFMAIAAKDDGKNGVVCIFQRYMYNDDLFVICGPWACGTMSHQNLKFVRELIEFGKSEYGNNSVETV